MARFMKNYTQYEIRHSSSMGEYQLWWKDRADRWHMVWANKEYNLVDAEYRARCTW
jgi:hypothetical protein